MLNLMIILVIVILTLWILCRLFAYLVIYIARRFLKIELRIGSVGFFTFGRILVKIEDGISLEISKVWLSSSYLSRDVRKPLSVCISEVRVEVDITKIRERVKGQETSTDQKSTSRLYGIRSKAHYLQILGVNLDNVDVLLVKGPLPESLIHISVRDIHADYNIQHTGLHVKLEVNNFCTKVFRSRNPEQTNGQTCLAEVSFSHNVSALIDVVNGFQVETLKAALTKPRVVITEAILLKLKSKFKRNKEKETSTSPKEKKSESNWKHFIPKTGNVIIEETEINISKEQVQRNLLCKIQFIDAYIEHLVPGLLRGLVQCEVKGIEAHSSQANLLHCDKLLSCVQINESAMDTSLQLDTCFVGYHHEEFNYWLHFFNQGSPIHHHTAPKGKPLVAPEVEHDKQEQSVFMNREITLIIKVERLSTGVGTANCAGIKGGVSQVKVNGSFNPVVSACGKTVTRDCRLSVELSTLYFKLVNGGVHSEQLSNKTHHWNTLFYLGVCIVNVTKFGEQTNLEAIVDCLQTEVSTKAVDVIGYLYGAMVKNKPISNADTSLPEFKSANRKWSSKSNKLEVLKNCTANIQCSNMNFFLCNEKQVYTVARIDNFDIQKWERESKATMKGMKVIYQKQTDEGTPILRSHEHQTCQGHVKMLHIDVDQHNQVSICISEDIYVMWSYALHLCIHQSVTDIRELMHKITGDTKPTEQVTKSPVQTSVNVNMAVTSDIMVTLHLSQGHKVCFRSPELRVSRQKGATSIKINQLNISCDDHEVFKFEGINVHSIHHGNRLKYERVSLGTLDLPTNRGWSIGCDKLLITFDYGYNFAQCLQQLINLNKWRKLVHNVVKKPFTIDRPLPPDLLFNIKSLVVQLNDAPFEVQLGDNYELMCDEHAESDKRLATMSKKIQDLQKTKGLLSGSKVDELFRSLKKKNAEVYIMRSQQLYASSPMRTKLFTWSLTNLEIMALADTSLHGKDNVVKHMKEIDPASPYPEGQEYTTMFCRMVNVSVDSFTIQLRDYALNIFDIRQLKLWGRFIGAEEIAIPRAKRSSTIEMEDPWGDMTVTRSMPPLKFYHDFSAEVQSFTIAYGPCWEPTMAQFNQSFDKINRPSVDPSTPLPFWDKLRLLLHGRLTMACEKMSWLYHASFDPYNTTEFMEWAWKRMVLDWTNAKWVLKGDLDICAKTASKYDDCKLLHLPNLRFCVRLDWVTLGDCNDHHAVQPCAPDKVPEFSMDGHDSYKAFRSQNLNISVSFETKPIKVEDLWIQPDTPSCLFYASTLRWMDKIKMCMARVGRPIRRGKYYHTTRPKKPQLSRHYKNLSLSVSIHQFQVNYWVSFAKQIGVEMHGQNFKLGVGLNLTLVPVEDGLKHRPRADWRIKQFSVNLQDTTIWLCGSDRPEKKRKLTARFPAQKSYFLSFDKVSYTRAEEKSVELSVEHQPLDASETREEDSIHKVRIHNLKGAWHVNNRNVAFSLFDGYNDAQNLKRNLGSDAMKAFKMDNITNTPQKGARSGSMTSPETIGATPSPLTRMQSGPAYTMLQKLVSEIDSKVVAVHEEILGGNVEVEQLHGVLACQADDVINRNWHIELYDSQVMVKGVETAGYVIISSGFTSVLSCEHRPVWKDQNLKCKTTWSGSIERMQYYATLEKCPDEISEDSIMWLSQSHIDDIGEDDPASIEAMLGSGQVVGGMVNDDANSQHPGIQLQRIVSRCKCQFFYASYGEFEDQTITEVTLPPTEETDMMTRVEGVDTFTLLHHDLNICTNALQYAVVLDIVNNLLLHVEPKKKELIDKQLDMRFQLELGSIEDQKTPILEKQNKLRDKVSQNRKLERELYVIQKGLDDDPEDEGLLAQYDEVEQSMNQLKDLINSERDELNAMICAVRESQLRVNTALKTRKGGQEASLMRRNEVCFKHAEWRMTERDGQIGIADIVLRNFLYTKLNRDDESGSHQMELGFVKVANLLPNSIYKDLLSCQDPQGFSDRKMMLRILCKFKAPIGGLSIKEHFEVNVAPLTIQLTKRFYTTVMAFFFPEKNMNDYDASDDEDEEKEKKKEEKKGTMRGKREFSKTSLDDIDKMKERAAKNNIFINVKIPEVPLRISYKGEKEKNVIDIHMFNFLCPTIEYQNQTWQWLDMLMAIKNDTKKVLISQAIKQKLHMRSRVPEELEEVQEEDKARMLFGAKLFGEKPSTKKNLFGNKK